MNRKHYNESERLALLREYYSSGLSKYAFIKKHNLSGSAILNKWIKKYATIYFIVPTVLYNCWFTQSCIMNKVHLIKVLSFQ